MCEARCLASQFDQTIGGRNGGGSLARPVTIDVTQNGAMVDPDAAIELPCRAVSCADIGA